MADKSDNCNSTPSVAGEAADASFRAKVRALRAVRSGALATRHDLGRDPLARAATLAPAAPVFRPWAF